MLANDTLTIYPLLDGLQVLGLTSMLLMIKSGGDIKEQGTSPDGDLPAAHANAGHPQLPEAGK